MNKVAFPVSFEQRQSHAIDPATAVTAATTTATATAATTATAVTAATTATTAAKATADSLNNDVSKKVEF